MFYFSLIPDAEILIVVQEIINEFPALQVFRTLTFVQLRLIGGFMISIPLTTFLFCILTCFGVRAKICICWWSQSQDKAS